MTTSQKSYYVKSGLFSFFEKGSVFIFGFIGTVILLRALTKEGFGTWALFLAATSLFEVGIVGLVQNGLVKYLTTAKEEEYAHISTASTLLNFILTSICALFLLVFAEVLSSWLNTPNLAYMLRIYTITLFIIIPFYQFNYIQQANLDFKGIFWSNFVRKGCFFLFVFISFFANFNFDVVNLVWVQLGCAILASFTSYYFAQPYLRFTKEISVRWISELFHYGKYVFGTNLSTMLYKTIDRLMLGSLLTPVAVGIYDVAIRITNLIDVPSMTVASVVFPQGAKKAATEGTSAIRELYEKSVGAILAIILPFIAAILLVPELVVTIVGGTKYLDTVPILRVTILFGLFLPFAIQFGTVLDSIGKPKINFGFTILGMFLNIILNYVFITKFGVIGAAYGTLTTYGITFVLYQTVLYKMFGVKAYRALGYIPGFYQQAYQIGMGFIQKKGAAESKQELVTKDK